jgi:hypothetical protein
MCNSEGIIISARDFLGVLIRDVVLGVYEAAILRW